MRIRRTRSHHRFIEPIEPRRLLSSTIYVDATATGAVHDGTTWNTAFVDLQQGLAAAVAGDEIRVADGTYKPTSGTVRTVSFQLKNGVTLLGGYAGDGAVDPNVRNTSLYPSTLSGEIGAAGSIDDNSYHVVTGSGTNSTAVLDGFVVTAGNANGTTSFHVHFGGGMYNSAGWPTVRNCVFRENYANSPDYGSGGGAMANVAGSVPTILDCAFINNSTTYYGGGIYNSDSTAIVKRSTFTGNFATYGGGAFCDGYGAPYVIGSTFIGNSTQITGGAIYTEGSNMWIGNCAFIGNSATDPNDGAGGAIANEPSSVEIVNCTFVANRATYGGAIGSATNYDSVRNCILWGNVAPFGSQISDYEGGTTEVAFSDVQGGADGQENIDADPQFVRSPSAGADAKWGTADDDRGDLRLRITSPCVDAADNSVVQASPSASDFANDLAGNPRKVDVPGVHDPGAILDMGAYERVAPFGDGQFLLSAPRPSVSVKFSSDASPASLSASDLILINVTTGQPIDCGATSSVSYDVSTRTATWAFAIVLPDGNYRATLPTASVTDSIGQSVLSADLNFEFFVLGGDANRDRKVDINDLAILAANWNGSAKVFSQGDFNYDGKVDAIDLGILSSRWQQVMAPPLAPAQSIALGTRPPTRTATRVISLIT